MGTGNYRHNDGRTVILSIYEDLPDSEEDGELAQILAQEAASDLLVNLAGVLSSTSFAMDGKSWRRDGRDARILAQNNLFQIWATEDSYGHLFVTYGINEDIEPGMEGLARAMLERRAEAFFDRLQDIYPLRVASSAWTSTPRRKVADLRALMQEAA